MKPFSHYRNVIFDTHRPSAPVIGIFPLKLVTEPEITIGPVTVGPETRVIIVKPPFSFFTLPTPAAAPKPPGDYMTTDEVAAYIKGSLNTIRLWCRLNTFPYIVLDGKGGDRVFSKKMVDRWMEKRAFNVSWTLTGPVPETGPDSEPSGEISERQPSVFTDVVADASVPRSVRQLRYQVLRLGFQFPLVTSR
jgi:hypothetical protein